MGGQKTRTESIERDFNDYFGRNYPTEIAGIMGGRVNLLALNNGNVAQADFES